MGDTAFVAKCYVTVVFWTFNHQSRPIIIYFNFFALPLSLHLNAIALRTLRGFVDKSYWALSIDRISEHGQPATEKKLTSVDGRVEFC